MKTMKNIERQKLLMKQGAIAGGLLGLIYVVAYFASGTVLIPLVSLIQFGVVAVAVYKGVAVYRDRLKSGFIAYSESLGYSILLGTFSGIVAGFVKYLLYKMDPTLLQHILASVEAFYLQVNPEISDEELDALMALQKKAATPFMAGFVNEVFSLSFWGLILGLIVSFFTKRKNDTFEAQFKDIEK